MLPEISGPTFTLEQLVSVQVPILLVIRAKGIRGLRTLQPCFAWEAQTASPLAPLVQW